MSVKMQSLLRRAVPALLGLSLLALASGCGEHQAPLASEPLPPSSMGYLAFSPEAARRAAKLATVPLGGLTASQIFSVWGGSFTVSDLNGSGVLDDLQVTFSVPSGGLNAPLLITMTVFGNQASDLVMAFDPAGLLFLGAAELKVVLGDDKLDIPLSDLRAYHAYDNGTVVDATILAKIDGDGTSEIRIEVPGFSRYGLSNGRRD